MQVERSAIEPVASYVPATPSAPIYVPAPAPVVAASPAPAADVPDAPTAADAAAMAGSDVDDAATLAAAGESVEGVPGELASPPLGNAPSAIETEGDSRNSPMV